MKIVYKNGDALKGPEKYTCHGCNSRGVMGSGIALQVKTDYPEAFRVYRQAFEDLRDPKEGLPLGSSTWVRCPDGRTIINGVTQKDYGRDKSIVYVSYEAVERLIHGINKMAIVARDKSLMEANFGIIESVAFPTIGAGLANGSWRTIASIIEAEAKDFEPVVYLFDGRMPQS